MMLLCGCRLPVLLVLLMVFSSIVVAQVVEMSLEAQLWQPKLQDPQLQRTVQNIQRSHYQSHEAFARCAGIINNIGDQGPCGACVGVSTASVLSDRFCIWSKYLRKVNKVAPIERLLSASNAASCARRAQTPVQNCKEGLHQTEVYAMAAYVGLVSGGNYKVGGLTTAEDGCVKSRSKTFQLSSTYGDRLPARS